MSREAQRGPAVWRGEELARRTDWIVDLDAPVVDDLDRFLVSAHDRGLEVPFSVDDAPLDAGASLIDRVLALLDEGPGLALVRGLPRHRYSNAECQLIYWALAVHLGLPVSQNARGHRIGDVRDQGLSVADPNVRVYQTNAKLDFHADLLPVDALGLLCLRTARRGGRSKVVSALTIHNVVGEERPDLLDVLYQPFNLDWRGEEPDGVQPWYRLPMFSDAEGFVTSRFTSLAYFRSVDRYGSELAMTPAQLEALELVQEIANRPGMALSMLFEEGDMQFLNNHVMLHARETYDDHDDPDLRRHLLRLWLAYPPERRRPLSPSLAERYRYVETGGIPIKRPSRSA